MCLSVLGSSILVKNITGSLYEKLRNQLLEITINADCCIQPEDFGIFTFIENTNHSKIYNAQSLCINENEALYDWKFFCILDLTNVPSGIYTIYSENLKDSFSCNQSYGVA